MTYSEKNVSLTPHGVALRISLTAGTLGEPTSVGSSSSLASVKSNYETRPLAAKTETMLLA